MKRMEHIDKKIIDVCNGITYIKPTLFERIKIFFGLMEFKPKKLKEPLLMDLIPKVRIKKDLKWMN